MSKILVDTIDTRSGTSNITIGSTNASQITLKSGATLTNFPANTPNFFANKTNDQTISSGTSTKVEFNTEEFDSDGVMPSYFYQRDKDLILYYTGWKVNNNYPVCNQTVCEDQCNNIVMKVNLYVF